MKRIPGYWLLCMLTVGLFYGCKKDYSNESFSGIDNSVKPDFSVMVNTAVAGFVVDNLGRPVVGATMTAAGKTSSTDEFGYFSIDNVSLPAVAGMVKVQKPGYFDGFRTFMPREGVENFVRLELLEKTVAGNFNAASGGSISLPNGTKIEMPAGAVVDASNAAYTGTVRVLAQWINPANSRTYSVSMPGDLRGIDSSGFLRGLETFGMMAVELNDAAGNKLQVAPGKQATLTMPIPSGLQTMAPQSIAFWSFNESNGLWKLEGMATKEGTNYVGKASHFSYWNCDAPFPLVNMKVQIVNEKLQPISDVWVEVIKTGTNISRSSLTDTAGRVFGAVPANSQLTLQIKSYCGDIITSKNFTTGSSPIDLGTISVSANQRMINLFGTVVDCNNQPVANGIVYTRLDSGYFRMPVKQGKFSNSFIYCGTYTNAGVLAVDLTNNVQGTTQLLPVQPGDNNLGVLTACGVSATEYLDYTVDGVKYAYTASDSLLLYYQGGTTSVIASMISGGSSNYIEFSFSGLNAVGGTHALTRLSFVQPFQFSGTSFSPAVNVAITEYGMVNEFVKGSFTTTVKDGSNNNHTVVVNFRMRRNF